MEDYYEYMFYVPLVHIKCRNWEEKKKRIFDHIEKRPINLSGEVFTDYFQCNRSSNEFFQDLFDEELNLFLQEINYKTKNIHSSWVEIAKNKNNHPVHNHQSLGYSAVCYVQFDNNLHEPTIFISPFLNFIDGNVLEHTPNVEEGSIVFFPSAIMHYTTPNSSEIDRIIVSFNIRDSN